MMKIFENWTFLPGICRNHLVAWPQTPGKRHNGSLLSVHNHMSRMKRNPARFHLKALLAVSAIPKEETRKAHLVYRQCRERLNGIVWSYA